MNLKKNFIKKFKLKVHWLDKKLANFNVYKKENEFGFARLAVITPKKIVKFSSKRNLIKRIIKESFRLKLNELNSVDYMIFTKNISINHMEKISINEQINKYFQKEVRSKSNNHCVIDPSD